MINSKNNNNQTAIEYAIEKNRHNYNQEELQKINDMFFKCNPALKYHTATTCTIPTNSYNLQLQHPHSADNQLNMQQKSSKKIMLLPAGRPKKMNEA